MKKYLFILVVLITSINLGIRADEGMWLLPLIEKLNMGKMTELGLKLSAEDIYSINRASLKDAVVIFGGGCTAEIVSPQGLLLTNHHCGYDQIQEHSSVEHDYLKDGFWAMSKEEELPNPGLSVTFLIRIEDVTKQVLAAVKDGMNETERNNAINEVRLAIQKKAMEGTWYNAIVSNFYNGNQFYLFVYERYNDVRLVGAPPSSIGKFGHDTDNWEWPRHTGDFSVFRVYTSPDGRPAPYSKNNIPLKPRYYLPVSIKELNKGDFAMVLGYPGRTLRYYTSYEVDELIKITHPNRIKIRGIRQEILMADMKADEKVNIQYASKYSNSSNYWKYSIGQKAGLEKLNVKTKKEEIENQYNQWVNENPERKAKYGEALNLIRNAIEKRAEYVNAQQYISECFMQGCEILELGQIASALISVINSGEQNRLTELISNLKDNISPLFYKDYNPPTDMKSVKAMMKLYREDVPAKFHPDFYVNIVDKKFKGDIDRFVDYMFAKSVFSDESKFLAFLEKPSIKVLERDPVYIVSNSINKIASEVSNALRQYDTDLSKGRRLWMAALMEMMPDKTQYPDANSTMRLTYGSVLDYDPRDAVTYKYYTTLKGVVEKYKPGDYEFDAPQRLLDLYDRKEFGRYGSSKGYMPVCFTTNNDITGGNSGSPVINAYGELIGLAFDGNWEAMSGDVAYEPDLQRTIAVDIRYVLWIMDVYAGARHLVDEMTVVK
ncbi:MAG TPA: S46 family peptidase [Bacteroidales bacterium]|nr:S46 family peptidase [Bacteroidales bacterium]HQG35921.1 S46 family peptidase [Bacteroidales bacterium]HQJ20929.1 S46 family peptidase [Bacteroidales bacterium]